VINDGNFDSAATYSQAWTPLASGQTESYTLTGLTAGTTYYMAIKALDDRNNQSGISNVPSALAQKDVTAPAAILNLSASPGAAPEGAIDITWTATGDDAATGTASFYIVKYSLSQITNQGLFDSANTYNQNWSPSPSGTTESKTLTGLTPGQTYYIAIEARDDANNQSGISNSPSAKAQTDIFPPAAITDLNALPGDQHTQVKLTWTAPGNDGNTGTATSYVVKYASFAINNQSDFNAAPAYSQSWTPLPAGQTEQRVLSGLNPGSNYYFAIEAKDEIPNQASLSNVPSAQAKNDTIPPSAINDLSASTGVNSGEINVSWTATGDDGNSGTATGYVVKYSTASITNQSQFDSANTCVQSWSPLPAGSTENHVLSGFNPGTTYYIAIEARDEKPNQGGLSNVPYALAQTDVILPSAISDISASGGVQYGTINLSWTAPGDDGNSGTATTYIVKHSTVSIVNQTDFDNAITYSQAWTPLPAGSTENHTLTGLTGSTTYYIAVEAKDEVNNQGSMSNVPFVCATDDSISPATINDLSAGTGVTEGMINLTWTAPGDDAYSGTATTYVVKYSTGNIANQTDFNNAATYSQSWTPIAGGLTENRTLTGMTGGVTYYIAVETKDEKPNQAGVSNVPSAIAQMDVTKPAPVTNLSAVPGTIEGNINISWTATGDDAYTGTATSYIVKYSTSTITEGNFNSATTYSQSWTPKPSGQTENQIFPGLAGGTTYYIAVKVKDDNNNTSDISNVPSSFAQIDVTSPSAITNITAVTGATEGKIDITWTAPGDDGTSGTATGYAVKYSTAGIANQTDFNNAATYSQSWTPIPAGSTESHTLTGLTGGTIYYIAIEAKDERNNQAGLSNVPSAMAQVDVTPPSAISDLSAVTGSTEGKISLQWTAVGDDGMSGTATGYTLKYSTALITAGNFDSATTYTQNWAPASAGTSENRTMTGLTAGTTYYVAIKTLDEKSNQSGVSNVPSAMAQKDVTSPANITNLSAVSGTNEGEINVFWTAPGDDGTSGTASTYLIKYSTGNITNQNDFNSASTYSQNWTPISAGLTENRTLTGLSDGITYYIAIEARDEMNNQSGISNVPSATAQTDTVPPAAINDLSASPGALEGQVNLTWTGVGDNGTSGTAAGYVVKYSIAIINSGNFDSAITYSQSWTPKSAGQTENRTISGLANGTTYYFAIKAKDEVPLSGPISNVPSVMASNDTVPPGPITDLSAQTGNSEGEVILIWTAPGDNNYSGTATSYVVKYSTLSITSQELFDSASTFSQSWTPLPAGSTETHTVTGLVNGTTYYLAIEAKDEVLLQASLSGSPSAKAQIDSVSPAAITNFVASTGANEGEIKLTWTATGDNGTSGTASGFIVKYSINPITSETDFNSATTYSQSWTPFPAGQTENRTISGLNPGTLYYVCIKVRDEANNFSGLSNTPSANAQVDLVKPAAITSLTAQSGANEGTINLQWIAVGDDGNTGIASSYVVKYSPGNITNQTQFDAAATYAQSWTPKPAGQTENQILTGLANGTTYYIAIEARDDNSNQGNLSNVPFAVATSDTIAPSAITNLTASMGSSIGEIDLTWTAPGDNGNQGTATSYVVKYSTSNITNQTQFNSATTYVQSWIPLTAGEMEQRTITGLTAGTTYYIAVEAKDEANNQATLSNVPSAVASSTANHLVISEIQCRTAASNNYDFVEIYNPTASAINLNGKKLVTRTANGTTDTQLYAWTSDYYIPAHKFVLWANNTYTTLNPPADFVSTGTVGNSFGVGLRDGPLDTGTIIDGVGLGTATNVFRETTAVGTPPNDQSVERKAFSSSTAASMGSGGADEFEGNGYDSNNNTNDFITRTTPQPQNSNSTEEPDISPPAAINDLVAATGNTEGKINISWTAPGDDESSGTATSYIVKYSTGNITNQVQFYAASTYTQSWSPLTAGSSEARELTGFIAGTLYYFAIEALDEGGNQGSLSNVPSAAAQLDVTPPANITNLSVQTGDNETEIKISWTAPGDDGVSGTAAGYIVKYSLTNITTQSGFNAASTYAQSWSPMSGGSTENKTLSGLTAGQTYYIAIETKDERNNQSGLSNVPSAKAQIDVLAPSAITSLSASTGATEGKIDLTWIATGDDGNTGTATGYVVKYSLTNITSQSGFNSATTYSQIWTPKPAGQTENKTLTGMTGGTTYYVAIEAVDDWNNQSVLGNVPSCKAQTDVTPPAQITGLVVSTGATEGKIDLTWVAAGDDGNIGTATSYVIKYSTSNITSQTDFNNATAYSQSWTPLLAGQTENKILTGLTGGMTYYIAIEAKDEVPNQSLLSNVPCVMAQKDVTPPSAVNNLSAATGVTEGKIDITWTATGDDETTGTATAYVVKYSLAAINSGNFDSATTYSQVWTPKPYGQTEAYTLTGLAGGTTCYIAIKAKDDNNNLSGISNVPSAKAQVDVTKPGTVTDISASTGTSESQVDLKWTATGDDGSAGTATAYILKYSVNPITSQNDFNNATTYNQSWTPLSSGTTESKTLSGLTAGTTYYFAVEAIDDNYNQSDLSNVPYAFAQCDVTSPVAITNLSAQPGAIEGDIDIFWTAPGDDGNTGTATSYVVKYSIASITNQSQFNAATTYAQSWSPLLAGQTENKTLTGLTGGVTYYIAIEAKDERNNQAGLSNVPAVMAQVDVTPPACIINLSANTGTTEGKIDLFWTAPGDDGNTGTATAYVVKYSTSQILSQSLFDQASTYSQSWSPVPAGQTESRTITGLTGGAVYYIAIEAKDERDNQAGISNYPSAMAQYDVAAPAAISDLSASSGAQQGEINLTWTAPGDDVNSGTAAAYIIKYALTSITSQTEFDSAATYAQSWTPKSAGQTESYTLTGLNGGTAYYIAVEAKDERNNQAELSNVSSCAAKNDAVLPGAVSDLSASTGSDAGSINISWTAPGDDGFAGTVQAYIVKCSTSAIDADNFDSAATYSQSWVPLSAGQTEQKVLTGLNPGTTYYMAIKSMDEKPNYSGISNVPSAMAQKDITPPGQVADLAAVAGTQDGEVILSWTATGDDDTSGTASSYIVKYSMNSINAGTFDSATTYVQSWIPLPSGQTENRTVTGLVSGTTYYFVVKAKDEADNPGNCSNSPSASAMSDTTAPSAIDSLSASIGAGEGQVNITWIAVGDDGGTGTAASYVLKYSSTYIGNQVDFDSAATYAQSWIPLPSGQTESKTLTGLTPGTTYYFSIEARDEKPNQGGFGNTTYAMAQIDTAKPSAINSLSCQTGTKEGKIDITWTATGDDGNTGTASSYVLKYSTTLITEGNFNSATTYSQSWMPKPSGQTEAYTLTGFTGGTTYYIAIKAKDDGNNLSDISNVPSAMAQIDVTSPSAITNISAAPGTVEGAIDLIWTATGDDESTGTATSYIVKYSTANITNQTQFDSATTYTQTWTPLASGNTENRTITGLTAGTTYFIAVEAQDERNSRSALSNVPSAFSQYDMTKPASINNLSAVTGDLEGEIRITWTAPGDDGNTGTATSYIVKYSGSNIVNQTQFDAANSYTQSWTPLAAGSSESKVLSGLTGGTTYYIAIETKDERNNQANLSNVPSAMAQVDVTPPSAIAGISADSGANEGEINLTWIATGDDGTSGTASGYVVKYSPSAITSQGAFNSAATYVQTWSPKPAGQTENKTVTGLVNGTTYYFAIETKDERNNQSPLSNSPSAMAQIDTVSPGAITNLLAVPGGTEGTVNLSWTASGDNNNQGTATSYVVKYSTSNITNQTQFNAANTYAQSWSPVPAGQTESKTLTDLLNGTTYYFAVEAKDEVPLQAGLSNVPSCIAQNDTVAPAAITNLAAGTGANEGEVRLTWTAPGDNNNQGTAMSYVLKYSASNITNQTQFDTATTYAQSWTPLPAGQTESKTLTGLVNGTTYYFAVEAKDEVPLQAGLSNVPSAMAQIDTVKPFAITSLTAQTGGIEGQIALSWIATGDNGNSGTASAYVVKYSVLPITSQAEFNVATTYTQSWTPVSAGTSESKTLSGLTDGTTYYIAIEAKDEANNLSDLSNVPSAMAQIDVTPPAAITTISAVSGSSEGNANLTWIAVGDDGTSGTATGYVVKYSTSNITNQTQFDSATAYVQSWTPKPSGQTETKTLAGLTNGTTYYFAIEAKDDWNNQGNLSNVPSATAQIDTVAPAAITDLLAGTGTSVGEIGLTFSAPGDNGTQGTATSYVVKYSTTGIANQTQFNSATTYVQSWTPLSSGTTETRTLTGLTAGTTYYIAIEAKDEVNNQAALSNVPAAVASSTANHLVISEIQIQGSSASDDFVEIYNPTGSAVNLNGKCLVKRTAAGGTDTVLQTWSSNYYINPRKYVLWANSSYASISVTPDFTSTGVINSNDGVGLRDGPADTGTIIDGVGLGTATNVFRETTAVANPPANQSVERKANGSSTTASMGSGGADEFEGNGYDTNNNNNDFITRNASQPQNSLSGEEPDRTPPAAITNLSAGMGVNPGEARLIWTATGDDNTTGTASGYVVKYSHTQINNDSDFTNATTFSQSWTPISAGSTEDRAVSGLTCGTTYYFAIKVKDEKNNISGISNAPAGIAQTSVTVNAVNAASLVAYPSTRVALLKLEIANNAGTGANSVEMNQVKIKFTRNNGTVNMTTADAQSLFNRIDIMIDNPSTTFQGNYQPALDGASVGGVDNASFNLTAGVQAVNVLDPDGDTNVKIVPGGLKRYFAVVELKSSVANGTLFEAGINASADVTVRDEPSNQNAFRTSTSSVMSQTLEVKTPMTLPSGWPKQLSVSASPVYSSPAYCYWDGRTYVGCNDGKIYTLNPDGSVYWSYQSSAPVTSSPGLTSPDLVSTDIYFTNSDGNLYKVRAGTGLTWQKSLGALPVKSSPTPYGNYVYVGTADGKLHKRTTDTGDPAQNWGFYTTGNISTSPCIDWNNYVYVGSEDGSVFRLNSGDGTVNASFSVLGSVTAPIFIDVSMQTWSLLNLYIGSTGGRFYARKADTFEVATNWPDYFDDSGQLGAVNCGAYVWQGYIYFGSDNGKFYKLDKNNGNVIWKFPAGGQTIGKIRGSPVVHPDNNYVYFGCDDGYFYAVDVANGTLRTSWPVYSGAEIQGMPTIDTDTNRLYFGSADGKMYRIDIGP